MIDPMLAADINAASALKERSGCGRDSYYLHIPTNTDLKLGLIFWAISGKRVVLIEDVTTTGGAVANASWLVTMDDLLA